MLTVKCPRCQAVVRGIRVSSNKINWIFGSDSLCQEAAARLRAGESAPLGECPEITTAITAAVDEQRI